VRPRKIRRVDGGAYREELAERLEDGRNIRLNIWRCDVSQLEIVYVERDQIRARGRNGLYVEECLTLGITTGSGAVC
jgi:hypothetical protein